MPYNFFIRIIIILVCNAFTRINSSKSSVRTSAVFYRSANKEGYKISYKDDPVGWGNIENIFYTKEIHSDNTPELLCVSGM